MKELEVLEFKKEFSKIILLEDVSFSLDKGKILAILGDSGSGKTTLLKCIGLLEPFDAGEIIISDTIIEHNNYKEVLPEIRNKIGVVFQDFNLWPHLSVLNNLILAPIKVKKEHKSKAIERAYRILKKLEIDDKAETKPRDLSGGQKQRVALARALMMKPEIILFDEPTSALDPGNVSKVVNIIKSLAKKGMTVVIATHEIGFAREVSDEFIFLSKKTIKESGSITNLNDPQSKALRKFLNLDK